MAKKVLPIQPEKGKVAAKAKAKAESPAPSKRARFIGATTGLGVMAYQNQSLVQNKKRKLTDSALALEWRREFPQAIATYTAETVAGVRGLYNKGKHGNDIPDPPLRGYDEEGNELPLWGEKSREREAAKAERAAEKAPAPKPSKPTIVRKVKKTA